MTYEDSSDSGSLHIRFFLFLGCYFAFHVVLRVLVSDSLDYDEAEQALLGQWLAAGYTEQPPLYTWIQYFFFQLFGRNVFAVSLLKNLLLFLTYIFVFFSSSKILKNNRAAILATASLLLIPQIGWESQRDMTHTTLVVMIAAATLWQAMRLVKSQSLMHYCLLGLLIGIGFLSKANFGLFLVILFFALLTVPEGRKIILNPQILITLIISIVVSWYYFIWIFNNPDIFFSATYKFRRGAGNYFFSGTLSVFIKSFLFLSPLWLIYLIVFPAGFSPRKKFADSFYSLFMTRYMLSLIFVLLVVVLLFKVSYVKDRWLQPLLFATPIFFFSRLAPDRIDPKRFKTFLIIAATAGVAIYAAFTLRVAGGYYTRDFCRLNYPFTAIADDIRQAGFSPGIIVSDNRFIAGNMLFRFPASTALIPDYRFEKLVEYSGENTIAVFWQADRSPIIPDNLARFLKKVYFVDTEEFPISYFEHPYKFGRITDTVKLAMIQFPLKEEPEE